MAYILNIRIEGDRIEDDDARIIACDLRGLSTREIEQGTFIKKRIQYNRRSGLYDLFDVEGQTELMYLALLNYFDYNFTCNGVALFDEVTLKRLYATVPRLNTENRRLIVNCQTVPPAG